MVHVEISFVSFFSNGSYFLNTSIVRDVCVFTTLGIEFLMRLSYLTHEDKIPRSFSLEIEMSEDTGKHSHIGRQ